MMQLAGKSVHVLGLGLSGVSAARLCLRLGARVTGIDQRGRSELDKAARELPIELVTGAGPLDLRGADLVVISPGVDPREALAAAAASQVEVIGEIELGARLIQAPICAVGGTNGKSTTTELICAMASAAGRKVFCGGNLGTPLSQAVGESWDCLIVEVSSFQLERVARFHPQVSVLLNITDDHLDRHGSFAAYAEAKGNAFVNQTPADVAIAPFGDREVERQVRRGAGRVCYFGDEGDYIVTGEAVTEAASGEVYSLAESELRGRHNRLNAAAAVAAARALGVEPEAIRRALLEYRPLPHRMAWVADIGGISFYDDSKATNVGAAVAAIESLAPRAVVLIAGGKGKQGSYAPLARALSRQGRAAVLIGESAPVMAEALAGVAGVELAPTLEAAVARAHRLARAGDAVLLAPACASFDMFRSYGERGERFVAAVRSLVEEGRA